MEVTGSFRPCHRKLVCSGLCDLDKINLYNHVNKARAAVDTANLAAGWRVRIHIDRRDKVRKMRVWGVLVDARDVHDFLSRRVPERVHRRLVARTMAAACKPNNSSTCNPDLYRFSISSLDFWAWLSPPTGRTGGAETFQVASYRAATNSLRSAFLRQNVGRRQNLT